MCVVAPNPFALESALALFVKLGHFSSPIFSLMQTHAPCVELKNYLYVLGKKYSTATKKKADRPFKRILVLKIIIRMFLPLQ